MSLSEATDLRWNICCDHGPRLAGLYRAVEDFRTAMEAGVISFDTACRPVTYAALATHDDGVLHIPCCTLWPWRGCHLIGRRQAVLAEKQAGTADLLIVHSLFRGHTLWAEDWASRHGRCYWAVPHGCLDPWGFRRHGPVKRLWLRTIGHRYLAHAQFIIFATHREREKASPWVDAMRSVVVPWPVEVPPAVSHEDLRATFRERYGIPSRARVLLYAARLHSMKRPLETIAAFRAARAPRVHLVMAGATGNIEPKAFEKAIPSAVRDRVHLVGDLDRLTMAAAWSAVDGFISLSWRENFGYSVAESLANSVPVIVSPGHDLAHEMPQGGSGGIACGWLLPDDSTKAAVEAIERFAEADDSCLAGMGRAGRSWASDTLAPARFRARLLAMAAEE